jgi:DNA polymerase III alpha subunit
MDFSLEGGDIRYGLNSIKGVSDKTWAALEAFRVQEKPTKYDIFLAAKQSGINIGLLSSLIQAGTLSSYSTRRTRLVLEAQTFNILSDREKTIVIDRAEEYNFDVIKTIHDLVFIKDSVAADGKKVMKESRKNTFKNKYESYKAIYEKNKSNENFANYVFETKLLGYCPSVKLKDIFNEAYGSDLYDIMEIRSLSQWDSVKVAASVVEVFDSKTRKDDKKFFKLVISDDTGMYNCIFMDNKKHAKLSEYLEDHKMPEKGQIIIVEGKKGAEDVIWVDFLSILDEKIYMKLSEVE